MCQEAAKLIPAGTEESVRTFRQGTLGQSSTTMQDLSGEAQGYTMGAQQVGYDVLAVQMLD